MPSRTARPARRGATRKAGRSREASAPEKISAIDTRSLPLVLRRVRGLAARREAPVVTLIAVATKDPWSVLSSCILSLRTQDATTAKAAARMFERWPDVRAMAAADAAEVSRTIYPVGFYRTKGPQLVEMAGRIVRDWGGRVPDNIDELLELKGVGRKTANLVVQAGYNKPAICVDTHVHRISNIWGYVRTKDAHATEMALREKLPARYWSEYNDLLVSFGQTICRPTSPRCSECPLDPLCPKRGVTTRR